MKFGRDLKNHTGFFTAKFAPLMLAILVTLTSGCAALVNGSGEPPPQAAVKISNVQATAQTVTKFQVSWSTNIPANSKVEYGTTVSYGSSTANTAPVAAHQLTVESLSPATLYHYRVRSVDAKNNEAVSTDFTYSTPDSTPPNISITSPSPATTLSGTVNVIATATDNIGIASVQFQVDGVNVGSLITAAPYTYSWDTTKTSNTAHTLTAVAKDAAGNTTTSPADSVTVNNAVAGPIASITSPASGAKVSGTVTASATATSPIGISSVQFQLDGVNLGSALTSAPYTYSWDTTKSSNAAHTLTAVAKDTAGTSTTSAADTVTVNNAVAAPVVSITSPASGAKVSGTVTASATATSTIGIASVQFQLDGANVGSLLTTAPFTYSWDTTKTSNAAHTLTAVAKDTAGTSTTSAADSLTVNNAVAAPVVSITSPASGAKVSGTVTASATATSAIGISSIQFRLDGVNVGSAITIAPYTYSWDTTKTSNAAHTLTAVAKDTAGSSTTSAADSVTVNNAVAAPVVSIASPASGAKVSGTVTASATATSAIGISSVQFRLDGVNVGSAITTAPYTYSWDTTKSSNAAHTLTAVAKDTAGTSTTSAADSVTVNNAVAAPIVTITSPASGAKVSGTVTASATATSSIGIGSVQFQLDGANVGSALTSAPYTYSWDTTKTSNAAHTLTAVAKDTAGTSTTSAGDTVTVNNAVAAPIVSITAPASSSTVTATVSVTATAASSIGIASVQFQLDGANVGSAVTTAPYTYSWDTTKSSNAAHTLTAVAKDTAGTSTTSAGDSVTVNNAIAPPTISITAPSNGATISGIVNVAGTAGSSASISLVQLSIDGGTFSNALGTTNWTFSLDTASLSNGSHIITAKAKDSLGTTTLSTPVQVTISNGTGPTVTVNWADVHQVIDGFGASSASTGWGITNSQADLFWSTTNGIGLSLLRVQIQSNGSYPELATMQKARDRGVLIWGTPWTPPASMKTNHSTTNGGSLLVADYQAYADYLAGYVSDLKNIYGVDLYAFSIQNEPNYSAPWESCIWNGTAFHDFLGHLYPAFAAKGVTSKIIMPESAQWTFNLATATLNDPATAAGVDIIAAHNYDGGGAVAYPLGASLGKHLWETEVSSFESFDPGISNGLRWAQKINDWMTIANANAWHYWWLISGNSDNEALLGPGGVTTKRLFAMGNFSKFVRPGYYRIGTSASPASGVSISAYKDPATGKFAIVAINHNSSAITLTFNLNGFTANTVGPWTTSATLNLAPQPTISVGGGNSFGATLPPASVTTFVGP